MIRTAQRPSRATWTRRFAAGAVAALAVGCGSTANVGALAGGDGGLVSGDAGILTAGPVNCTTGPNYTGCPCTQGDQKVCYTGPVATEGVGPCHDGVQQCVPTKEANYAYGPCTGETVPTVTATCASPGADAAIPPADGGTDTGTTTHPDAAGDGGVDAGACTSLGAPRPIAPVSTGRVTTFRPTLEWVLPAGATGAQVTLCHDRGCSSVISDQMVTGTKLTVAADLAPGVVFWKLAPVPAPDAGCTQSPVWEFVVPHVSAPLDTSWGSLLDVNGDGLADLVITQGYAPATLYVFFGSPTGIGKTPDQTIAAQPGNQFAGPAVGNAGDVNGDGYADVIVGSQGTVPGVGGCPAGFSDGHAWIYAGGPNGLSTTPISTLTSTHVVGACSCGNPTCDFFGREVATAGDVNRDGYADILVGTFDDVAGLTAPAYLYYGGPSGTGTTGTSLNAGTDPTVGLSTAGDVNGDGYADVVVGSEENQTNGFATVFLGAAAGIQTTGVPLTITGFKGNASPICAGDLNGDGLADLAQANPDGNQAAGSTPGDTFIRFYYGAASGVTPGPTTTLAPTTTGWTGGQLTAGDIWGTGYGAVVSWVSAFNLSGQPDLLSSYNGSASGVVLPGSLLETVASPTAYTSVAVLGDVNGDGYSDTAIVVNGTTVGGGGVTSTLTIYYGAASSFSATTITLPLSTGGVGGELAGSVGGL